MKKQIKKIQKDIEAYDKKLSNSSFLEKAPAEIVEDVREKVHVLRVKLEKLNKNLDVFEMNDD